MVQVLFLLAPFLVGGFVMPVIRCGLRFWFVTVNQLFWVYYADIVTVTSRSNVYLLLQWDAIAVGTSRRVAAKLFFWYYYFREWAPSGY